MLKSLIAVGLASILISQPPQNTNDGTYYQDVNITETYEYETNEVNSVDDLVDGNIYHFTYDKTQLQSSTGLVSCYGFYNLRNDNLLCFLTTDTSFNLTYYPIADSILAYEPPNVLCEIRSYGEQYIECDILYKGIINATVSYTNFSASDYLGEKTITIEPVETEGLYNLAYHFLYSRIYTNTELQGMETTLFGTTINMNMWLSHTTAIVIICLLLIVLIKFVIWLFKIVSGGMLWK